MGVAQIKMPQLGESVTEGTVEKWLKREGEFVKRDEPIVEVVTDKVNAEIPSPFEGTLVKIDAGEGQVVRVGAVIAQIETAAAAAAAPSPAPAKAAPAPAAAAAPTPVAAPAQRAAANDEHARLSPAVRKLATERGIDPTSIQGSGLGGRVTREDVLAAAAPPAAPARPTAPAAPSAPARLDGAREELVKLS